MAGDPTKVYRFFKNHPDHIMKDGDRWRLVSGWFNNPAGVSVELGEKTSPLESYERHKPCGIAGVDLELLRREGLAPEIDPQDTPEDLARNPAHRIVRGMSNKAAKRITKGATIIISLPDVVVIGGDGSTGVAPETLRAAEGTGQEDGHS